MLPLTGPGFFTPPLPTLGSETVLATFSSLLAGVSRQRSADLDTLATTWSLSVLLGLLWTDWLRLWPGPGPGSSSVLSPIIMTVLVRSPPDMTVLSVTTFL